MKFTKVLALIALVGGAVPVQARYKMGVERPFSSNGPGAAKSSPEAPVLQSLSNRYGTPVERLKYYRRLHYGYEEIVPALIVAREAQVEEGRVLKCRMENLSWKAIAEKFSVELKPLNQEVFDVLKPIRSALPETALKERPLQRSER